MDDSISGYDPEETIHKEVGKYRPAYLRYAINMPPIWHAVRAQLMVDRPHLEPTKWGYRSGKHRITLFVTITDSNHPNNEVNLTELGTPHPRAWFSNTDAIHWVEHYTNVVTIDGSIFIVETGTHLIRDCHRDSFELNPSTNIYIHKDNGILTIN